MTGPKLPFAAFVILRDAHISNITIFNVLTGIEIADVELLLVTQGINGQAAG